jgi:uncharacterized protein (TIGR03435 family)
MKVRFALAVLACMPACAQEFEAASVKPNLSGAPGFGNQALPGGRYEAKNISLRRLIAVAYAVTDHQIFGDIKWLDSDRFDVSAKGSRNVELSELRLMIRALLAERFNLKVHSETRELSRLSLTAVKPGIMGPGLTAAPGMCGPDSGACGTANIGRGRVNAQHAFISQLADRLAGFLGETVIDNTGLPGTWDIKLTWTPDPEPGSGADPTGPSLFTAIQEQLGLKLQSGKGPVPVVVIDSAERPASN